VTAEALQQLRFVVLYPAIATFGLFWAAVFWLRFRRGRCVGDFWAGTLAMAMALWALAGIAALWIADRTGFSEVTSLAFTLGMLAPALVLCAGVAVMMVRGWRRGDNAQEGMEDVLSGSSALHGAVGHVRRRTGKGPHVLTATVFTAGPMGWEDFEVDREMNDMINAHIQAQGGSYAPAAPSAPPALGDLLKAEFGADYEDLSRSLPRHATAQYQERDVRAIDRVVLHHTEASKATTWHSVAQYHVNSNGWPGIGYHIGVRSFGGRVKVSLLNDPRTRSYHAHTVGNDRGLAVCLAGSFIREEPTVEEVDVLRRVVQTARRWTTWTATPLPVVGHRDVPGNQTSCPGDKLAAVLPWLNSPDTSNSLIWAVAKTAQAISPNSASAIEVAMRQAGYTPIGNETDVRSGSTWLGVAQLGYCPIDGHEAAFFATNLTPDGQWTVRQVNKP